jgi:P27 family predicted phage terminase small subunit
MRGRKPKPLKRQIAEGDTRKKGVRKLQEQLDAEPKAARGLPDCPEHLSGRARDAWEFWSTELAYMNLDSRPDAMMLEGACVAWARAVAADLMIAELGSVTAQPILSTSGELLGCKYRTNPAVAVSHAAWKQLRSFCSEFGLSPASRTRLTIEKHDNGEKDLMALLSTPREPRKPIVQ